MNIDQGEELTAYIERLLETAAAVTPDLAEQPLYIVNRSLARNNNAIFGPGYDRMFEEEIANVGKWNGPGLCIVADQAKIYDGSFAAARAAGFDQARSDESPRVKHWPPSSYTKWATELNAAAERRRRFSPGEWPLPGRHLSGCLLTTSSPACVQAVAVTVQPWHHNHDLPFIRCCGMLYGRLLGELPLRFGQVVDTTAYGLAAPKQYMQAMQIDGDLNFSDRTPIRKILANSPPGPVLRERWRADVFDWFEFTEGRSRDRGGGSCPCPCSLKFTLWPATRPACFLNPVLLKGNREMELLEQVKTIFTGRQRKKAADFDELVRMVADGKAPSPAEIAELLETCGKKVEDLAAGVTHRQGRVSDAAKWATLPRLREQLADLQRQRRGRTRALCAVAGRAPRKNRRVESTGRRRANCD